MVRRNDRSSGWRCGPGHAKANARYFWTAGGIATEERYKAKQRKELYAST